MGRFHCSLGTFLAFCALPLAAQVKFTTQTIPAPSGTSLGISISVDLDRDGNPDIISTDSNNSQLVITYGTGGGNFAAPEVLTYLDGPAQDVKVGDFNGDGNLDILVSCGIGKAVVILTGNGNLTFNYNAISTADSPYQLALGDFNGDGKLDFAVSLNSTTAGYIQIYTGNGNATFTAAATLPLPNEGNLVRLLAADLNKDGSIDLISVAQSQTTIFLNNGNGAFAQTQTLLPPGPSGVPGVYGYGDLGDLNGDAVADLLLTDSGFCGHGCGYFQYLISYLNDGTGHFTLKQQVSVSYEGAYFGLLADLNYDGKKDFLYDTYYSGGTLGYALGKGDGTFQAPNLDGSLNADFPSLAVHDLNNDSLMDVISTGPNSLMLLLNNTLKPGCLPPNSSSLASNVCSPAPSQVVNNTFRVRAAANGPLDLWRMEEWVDGEKVYQRLSNEVSNNLNLSNGPHILSVVAVDVLNNVEKKSIPFTVCGAPSSPGVAFCTPANGSTVTSPVSVIAIATPTSGTTITSMRLYVDNVAKTTVNGAKLSARVGLTAGPHNLAVVAYEANGGALSASESITVH